jgi:long-chain alkane monooxygenase
MSERKRMLLGAVVMYNGSHALHGLWRHPDAADHREFMDVKQWIELAELLERGRFDLMFFADVIGAYDIYGGDWKAAAREGVQFPNADPLTLLAALAPVTEHLGLAATSSVFLQNPFQFARQFSTLDHISGGRAGWNIVTSVIQNGAANVGIETLPSHDDRYLWADEYADVVLKLWERSWEEGSLTVDPETGVFADPAKVHEIGHVGERYRVGGPHQVPPSPQRTPLLFQAGASPVGRDFAARNAEGVFVTAANPGSAAKIVADIRARTVAAGRGADDIKFLAAQTIVTGGTEEEARRKDAELAEWVSEEGMMVMLSGHMQTDLAEVDLDRPLADFSTEGMQGILADLRESVPPEERARQTFRDVLGRFWDSRLVGAPEQIADRLEEWQDAGVDGAMVIETLRPQSYVEFVDLVVPVLQDRGLVQREYAPGTLREKLFGRGPHLPSTHRAHSLPIADIAATAASGRRSATAGAV